MYRTVVFYVIVTVVLTSRCCLGYMGCKDISSNSPELRLKRHLFCDYDPDIRPAKNIKDTLTVSISFLPVSVDLDEHSGTLDFHTWIVMDWKDVHLTWTPSDFEGINVTYVKSDDVWTPDFSVFNSGDLGKDQNGLPSTDCHLQWDGQIQCAAAQVYTTHCPADFTNWPYDKHNCTLTFGSWMHYGDEVVLQSGGMLFEELHPNRVWDIQISDFVKVEDIDNIFSVHVGLQRIPMRGGMAYIAPSIVLTIITLTVLWLDARSVERIAVASVSFLSHILLVLDLNWYLPSSGTLNTPKILIFYETSLIISACILVFTSFLRKIYSMSSPAPAGVVILTSSVINSPVGRFVKTDGNLKNDTTTLEEGENERSTEKPNQTWQECAVIFDWLSLVLFTLTYIILICVLVPLGPKYPIKKYII